MEFKHNTANAPYIAWMRPARFYDMTQLNEMQKSYVFKDKVVSRPSAGFCLGLGTMVSALALSIWPRRGLGRSALAFLTP